jgi:hypothetical protein
MGSTLAALICQLRSGDLVVIIAYPTAATCSKKRNSTKTSTHNSSRFKPYICGRALMNSKATLLIDS